MKKDEFIAGSIYKLPLAMLYYDKVNSGDYTMESTLPYSGYMHEDAGVISSNYTIGSQIPLSELLDAKQLFIRIMMRVIFCLKI